MEAKRDAIPADLKRRVFIEAGHRCAIPTCRVMSVHIHHIEPWANNNKHEYENLIALCPNCHSHVHDGKIDRKSLRIYKYNLRSAYDKYSFFEMDFLFELHKAYKEDPKVWLSLPPFMSILFKRLLDAQFIHWDENNQEYSIKDTGVVFEFARYKITQGGIDYIESLSVSG